MPQVIDLCDSDEDKVEVVHVASAKKRKEVASDGGGRRLGGGGGSPPAPVRPSAPEPSAHQMLMPGEAEALARKEVRSWKITQSRDSDASDPSEQHYRLCESQWNRQLGAHRASFELRSVEYFCNPKLLAAFEAKRREYDGEFGKHVKLLAFHGTPAKNVPSIMQNGFKIGKVGSTTDPGWYGKGMYFSEFAHVSLAYCGNDDKMLLCRVLLGRPYTMANVKVGSGLQPGYTSHINNNNGVSNGVGTEVVIFDEAAMLPVYALTFARTSTPAPSVAPAIAMPTMAQAVIAGAQSMFVAGAQNMMAGAPATMASAQPGKTQAAHHKEEARRRQRKRPVNSVRTRDGSQAASAMNDLFKVLKKSKS